MGGAVNPNRREMLAGAAGLMAIGATGRAAASGKTFLSPGLPAGTVAEAELESLPGKKPLIRLTYRPPNYETPLSYFQDVITPNDAFFVRWHLADIPELDAAKWRLNVAGATPLSLSLDQLKSEFAPVEIVAVCQCSGNRRGLSDPHVPGVQWGFGAMGNARWKGARLKDILANAGVPADTIEIEFDGADGPVLDKTPDFIKSIPLWKAMDENTIVAYEMNGQALPHFNGFPARLIVPGWTATYWMKKLVNIKPLNAPAKNFWVATAYRVPARMFPSTERFTSQEAAANTPITEIMVNSVITAPANGETVKQGPVEVKGLAWDGGHGIASVEISIDGGLTWSEAQLGEDLGRFSFRPFSFTAQASKRGKFAIMSRAANAVGQAQVAKALTNPAGYHHNVFFRIELDVA
jgi:DMSO/TMAO reductase YedYZ molybdopterin-dependent catalytic subunit